MKTKGYSMPTNALVSRLAAEAGTGRPGVMSPANILFTGSALAFVTALCVVLLAAGPRPDFWTAVYGWNVHFKILAMLLLAAAGLLLVRRASIPGLRLKPAVLLAPGALFLAVNLMADRSGYPLLGTHPLAVTACVATIILASLPALALVLAALRSGIPTRPAQAGATAGLLAGSLGALAYTVACVNDGAAFVTLWYGLAIAAVTATGALAGTKVLRW